MDTTLTSASGVSKEVLQAVAVHDNEGQMIASIREREDGSIYVYLPQSKIESISDTTLNLLLIPPMRNRLLPSNREVEGE